MAAVSASVAICILIAILSNIQCGNAGGQLPRVQAHRIGNWNEIIFNAIEHFSRKLEKTQMCQSVTKKISDLSKEGDIYEEEGKYIEITIQSGKFVPLLRILPLKLTSPQLAFVSFDCKSNEFIVESQPGLNVPVIPGIMKLKNTHFTATSTLTRIPETMEVETKGIWVLGPLSFKVNITYFRSSGSTEIKIDSKSVSIDKIVKQLTGLTLPGAPQHLHSFQFTGYTDPEGSSTLMLSSDQTKKNKFYAFYHQDRGQGAPAKAIAAEISNLRLSSILKSTIRIDISKVPIFGRMAVKNIGFTVSSQEITELPKNTFAATKLLNRNGVAIEKGLKAYVLLPFMSKPVSIAYSQRVLTLRTSSSELGLKSLLKFISSKFHLGKLRLPKQLDAIFSFHVHEIKIFRDKFSITIAFSKPISLFKNFLGFSDIMVTLYISNKSPKLSVRVTGNIHLAGTNFKTALFQDKNNKYTLTAKGDYLDFRKVIVKFSAAVLPDVLSAFFENIPFLHIGIEKPYIEYKFSSKPSFLRLGGTPVIYGFKAFTFDMIITKMNGKVKVILGFEMLKINIADILEKITKYNFKRFGLFNQELAITITLSPHNNQDLHFLKGGLRGVPINKGVSITATMRLPSDCDEDKVCRLVSQIVGKDVSLSIQASIQSVKYFSLTAALSNLHLGKYLIMKKVLLKVVGGPVSTVGFVGAVELVKPGITFSSTISTNSEKYSLGLSMGGCLTNLFTAKWLSICNLLGSIALSPPFGEISSFELGGEIRLGFKSSGHQIKAKGYIGFSPDDNYYYVSFTKTTVGSILKAFKINLRIPKPLAISGFPKGFLSSYSQFGKELPEVKLNIPAGFKLKGTLVILGLKGDVHININLPSGVIFKVYLPPIKIAGGLLKMYASATDSSKGPYLDAVVQLLPRPYINIEAKGYVKILGITAETSLKVTGSEFRYFIRGSIWGLFQAELLIHARYGNIQTAGFRIKGKFKNDLFKKIEVTVVNALNSSAKKATAAISRAKEKLERAKLPFQRGINKLRKAQWKVHQAKGKIQRAANKVASIRKRLHNKCHYHKCKKWWKFKDPKCLARNTACWLFRKGVLVALKIAEKFVHKVVVFLHIANAALWEARKLMKFARSTLDVAKRLLSAVNWTYRFAIKAASWIIRYTLSGIISIRRIYFDVSLKLVRSGHMTAAIDVTFLKSRRVNAKINLNIKCIHCIAKEVCRRIGKGISNLIS